MAYFYVFGTTKKNRSTKILQTDEELYSLSGSCAFEGRFMLMLYKKSITILYYQRKISNQRKGNKCNRTNKKEIAEAR